MMNTALRISSAAIMLNVVLWSSAFADSKRQPLQPTIAQSESAAIASKLVGLPSCEEVFEKYHDLAGKLPEDYPALYFDKEEFVKTMVEIADKPNITTDELTKIFGLKFIACKRATFVKDGQPKRFEIEYLSDGGFPLKAIRKKYDASVSISGDLNGRTQKPKSRLLYFSFDFNGDNAKVKTKMDVANCIVESDFHEYLKDKWELAAYYGNAGFKNYKREIDGLKVQFTARPYSIPEPKLDTRHPFAGVPICIQSVSILIQADK